MLAKSIKFAIVFAVILTLFGGTAMADNRGRDGHRQTEWNRGHHHQSYERHHQAYAHRSYNHHKVPRVIHRQPVRRVVKANPLAPRIVFLGPIPVPVPPSPHEVLGYLSGHR